MKVVALGQAAHQHKLLVAGNSLHMLLRSHVLTLQHYVHDKQMQMQVPPNQGFSGSWPGRQC